MALDLARLKKRYSEMLSRQGLTGSQLKASAKSIGSNFKASLSGNGPGLEEASQRVISRLPLAKRVRNYLQTPIIQSPSPQVAPVTRASRIVNRTGLNRPLPKIMQAPADAALSGLSRFAKGAGVFGSGNIAGNIVGGSKYKNLVRYQPQTNAGKVSGLVGEIAGAGLASQMTNPLGNKLVSGLNIKNPLLRAGAREAAESLALWGPSRFADSLITGDKTVGQSIKEAPGQMATDIAGGLIGRGVGNVAGLFNKNFIKPSVKKILESTDAVKSRMTSVARQSPELAKVVSEKYTRLADMLDGVETKGNSFLKVVGSDGKSVKQIMDADAQDIIKEAQSELDPKVYREVIKGAKTKWEKALNLAPYLFEDVPGSARRPKGDMLFGSSIGLGAGMEKDENGNWQYNTEKGLKGAMYGSAVGGILGGKNAKNYLDQIKFSSLLDKMPRFEIDDSGVKFKNNLEPEVEYKLADVITHKELFKNYPELKTMKVEWSFMHPGTAGVYDDKLNKIFLYPGEGSKETLLHEIQHAIQNKEGFARGGGPGKNAERAYNENLFEKYRSLRNQYEKTPTPELKQKISEINKEISRIGEFGADNSIKGYNQLSGELESRAVQRRMDMPANQRGSVDPYAAEAIATTGQASPKQFITRFDSGTSASAVNKIITKGGKVLDNTVDAKKQLETLIGGPTKLLQLGYTKAQVDTMSPTVMKKILDGNITPTRLRTILEQKGSQALMENRASAEVAQAARQGLSSDTLKNIAKVKMYAKNKDIGSGSLVGTTGVDNVTPQMRKIIDQVSESIQESRPYDNLSEEEALDIALNLPTGKDAIAKIPQELKQAKAIGKTVNVVKTQEEKFIQETFGKLQSEAQFNKSFGQADSSMRSQTKAYYDDIAQVERAAAGPSKKVNLLDWFRTPDRVLNKLGLANEAKLLRTKYQDYLKDIPVQLDKINGWFKQVGESQDSSRRIFKYLDGQGRPDLSPTELKVATEMQEYMAQWADKLSLPKDKRIASYITHIFERDIEGQDFDPDLAKIIADKVPGTVYDPFLQARLGKKGYIEDAFRAMDAYVKRATRKYHMDQALTPLKDSAEKLDIDSWNYVKKYADRINLRPDDIDNLADNLIKSIPGVGYRFTNRPTAFLTKGLRQMIYRGTLGLNVGSALKNMTQGANTYAQLGEKYTGIGYMKAIRSMLSDSDELTTSGVLSDTLIQDRNISATKKFWEKLDKGLFTLFDGVEKLNRGAAYYGAKAQSISKGMSEKEAIQAGVDMARKTQFTFGNVDTPMALQGDLMKTLTQFQSYNVKQTEFIAEMLKNKEFGKSARWLGANLFIIAGAGQLLGMDIKDLIPSFRIGGSPFFQLGKDAVSVATNANDPYGNERSPKDKAALLAKDLVPFVPGGVQTRKTVQGMVANQQGGVYTPGGMLRHPVSTLKDQIIGPVLGVTRTDAATSARDGGSSYLSKNQTALYDKYGTPEEKQQYYDSVIANRQQNKQVKGMTPNGVPQEKPGILKRIFGNKEPISVNGAAEKQRPSNYIYYDSEDMQGKSLNLAKYTPGSDESFKKAVSISESEGISEEDKTNIIDALGVKPIDLKRYAYYSQSDEDKARDLSNRLYNFKGDKQTLYKTLITLRNPYKEKTVLNNKVIDYLVELGNLSEGDAKLLKKVQYNKLTGKLYVDMPKPKTVKAKKINITPMRKSTVKVTRRSTQNKVRIVNPLK